jgi:prepilin-type N-terminal cleavage/methylation domain-containing protein
MVSLKSKVRSQKLGFTLIELLITIALIGILSAIIAMSMVNPQKEARDAKRKSDLELIRSGLQIYNSDCGQYPGSIPAAPNPLMGSGASADCLATNSYITTIPTDPTSGRNYSYVSNGTTYSICAALEMTPSSPPTIPVGCSCGATCNYVVVNP